MFTLYTVGLRHGNRSLQSVLVSARNKTEATRRAKQFVKTHGYDERLVNEFVNPICKTPDDVLEWS